MITGIVVLLQAYLYVQQQAISDCKYIVLKVAHLFPFQADSWLAGQVFLGSLNVNIY